MKIGFAPSRVAPHTRRVSRNFLVHGDGGTEEDEEGGSQKGEAQE